MPPAGRVSSAAPYRHFRDRQALLADVARRGFELFEAAPATGVEEGGPIRFALSRMSAGPISPLRAKSPPFIRRCSRRGSPLDGDTGLREAADRAFAVLRRAADAFCARLPNDRRPPALMMSLHLWALAHGIASLFARADAGRRKLPMTPEELLEAGVLVYLRGLRLVDGAAG